MKSVATALLIRQTQQKGVRRGRLKRLNKVSAVCSPRVEARSLLVTNGDISGSLTKLLGRQEPRFRSQGPILVPLCTSGQLAKGKTSFLERGSGGVSAGPWCKVEELSCTIYRNKASKITRVLGATLLDLASLFHCKL
jgi:hypothetical protein